MNSMSDNQKPILSTDEVIEILERKLQKAEEQVRSFEELFPYSKSNHRKDCFLIRSSIQAIKFKREFDRLYGRDLQIANWHLNGDLEPFDNFYEDACG